MEKKHSVVLAVLFFTFLLCDLKAEPGLNGVNQFRRRNYYVDMFSDTWRANVSIGGEMYFGEDDLLMISMKRIAPSLSIGAVKDISGLVGIRLKTTMNGHKNFYYPKDIIPFYSIGASADVMLNSTKILAPYAEAEAPKFWLYLGIGSEYSFEQALHKKYEEKRRISPTYNMGTYSEIYLNEQLYLTVEIRGTVVAEYFDGQVHGIATEGYANFLMGITYRFY